MAGLNLPQPLNANHVRENFDCGRAALNTWFQRRAWHNQQADVSRTSVVCDSISHKVAGFVSLSATQVERAWLLKAHQRNQPDPLPAILLGQLAVDLRYQGRGYSKSLMLYALTTAVRLSQDIGCYCVLTHPLDEGVREFYRNFGFDDLPYDPARSMAVRIIDLKKSGF